jgi:hypothetical protein
LSWLDNDTCLTARSTATAPRAIVSNIQGRITKMVAFKVRHASAQFLRRLQQEFTHGKVEAVREGKLAIAVAMGEA